MKIPASEVFEAFVKHLDHLVDCRTFLYDVYSAPSKPLHKALEENRSSWDKDNIRKAIRYVEETPTGNAPLQGSVATALLAEVPSLQEAKEIVTGLLCLRYGELLEVSREVRIQMANRGERTLRERLDQLNDFDDSE